MPASTPAPTAAAPSSSPAADPLAMLGLTDAKRRELNEILRALQEAEEKPYEAIDAMIEVSSLEIGGAGDNARLYLIGGDILEYLSDLICICDEDWISAASDEDATAAAAEIDEEERKAALELCGRALNTLGSLCTFTPFLDIILEQDCADDPLDSDVTEPLARAITPDHAKTFKGQKKGKGPRILRFPLLCAVLFWARESRFQSCRSHAFFALSWLLTDVNMLVLYVEIDVISILFDSLKLQVRELEQEGVGSHVSSTQENVRLYSCICLQRLSRSPFPLFADQKPDVVAERFNLLLNLLHGVHSFNIRAILLNVILQAVSPPPSSTNPSFTTFSLRGNNDLPLPLSSDAVNRLKQFREECGSIGSSQSSRRTSPALDALAGSARSVPPMPLPATSFSTASSSSAAAAPTPVTEAPTTERRPSYAAAAQSNPNTRPSSASTGRATASAVANDEDEDDEVGELSDDIERRVDKTAQLHALVDAILEKSSHPPSTATDGSSSSSTAAKPAV